MAGRVGAGNIVGVTGAVTIGGPGANFLDVDIWLCRHGNLLWEATLAQIYKEKKGDEYVGIYVLYPENMEEQSMGGRRYVYPVPALQHAEHSGTYIPCSLQRPAPLPMK